jgi:hypothetical protein
VYLKRYEEPQRYCDSRDNGQCDTGGTPSEGVVEDVEVRGVWWKKSEKHAGRLSFSKEI